MLVLDGSVTSYIRLCILFSHGLVWIALALGIKHYWAYRNTFPFDGKVLKLVHWLVLNLMLLSVSSFARVLLENDDCVYSWESAKCERLYMFAISWSFILPLTSIIQIARGVLLYLRCTVRLNITQMLDLLENGSFKSLEAEEQYYAIANRWIIRHRESVVKVTGWPIWMKFLCVFTLFYYSFLVAFLLHNHRHALLYSLMSNAFVLIMTTVFMPILIYKLRSTFPEDGFGIIQELTRSSIAVFITFVLYFLLVRNTKFGEYYRGSSILSVACVFALVMIHLRRRERLPDDSPVVYTDEVVSLSDDICLHEDVVVDTPNLLLSPGLAQQQFLKKRHSMVQELTGSSREGDGETHRARQEASSGQEHSDVFMKICRSQKGFAEFRSFLVGEFAEENLDFWKDASQLAFDIQGKIESFQALTRDQIATARAEDLRKKAWRPRTPVFQGTTLSSKYDSRSPSLASRSTKSVSSITQTLSTRIVDFLQDMNHVTSAGTKTSDLDLFKLSSAASSDDGGNEDKSETKAPPMPVLASSGSATPKSRTPPSVMHSSRFRSMSSTKAPRQPQQGRVRTFSSDTVRTQQAQMPINLFRVSTSWGDSKSPVSPLTRTLSANLEEIPDNLNLNHSYPSLTPQTPEQAQRLSQSPQVSTRETFPRSYSERKYGNSSALTTSRSPITPRSTASTVVELSLFHTPDRARPSPVSGSTRKLQHSLLAVSTDTFDKMIMSKIAPCYVDTLTWLMDLYIDVGSLRELSLTAGFRQQVLENFDNLTTYLTEHLPIVKRLCSHTPLHQFGPYLGILRQIILILNPVIAYVTSILKFDSFRRWTNLPHIKHSYFKRKSNTTEEIVVPDPKIYGAISVPLPPVRQSSRSTLTVVRIDKNTRRNRS